MRILWGKEDKDVDPSDLTVDNAYKTRWIWYHTILGLLMLMGEYTFNCDTDCTSSKTVMLSSYE